MSMHIFELAANQSRWLTERQAVVAQNIANVSTPAYKARDITPFETELDATRIELARTNPAHLDIDAGNPASGEITVDTGGDVNHSGNNVALEREFVKSSDIERAYSLNTSVVKSFNRMLALSAKA